MADKERFLAIFASGSGSTGSVLFDMAKVVVTDRRRAGIIQRVEEYNLANPDDPIGMEIAPRPRAQAAAEHREDIHWAERTWSDDILERLGKYNPSFISLNGFNLMIPDRVVAAYAGRMTNVHPAPLDPEHRLLLPPYLGKVDEYMPGGREPLDFGGNRMSGLAPHEAVLAFSEWCNRIHWPFRSEVCIHLVEAGIYDNGAVLARAPVGIIKGDTAESLQDRAKEAEKLQNLRFWTEVQATGKLPEALSLKEPLIKESEIGILWQARARARWMYPGH